MFSNENPQIQSCRASGLLFLLAMAAYMVGSLITINLTSAPSILSSINNNTLAMGIAGICMLLNSIFVACIAIFLYPILKIYSETLARIYFSVRLYESTVLSVGFICLLALVPLSFEFTQYGENGKEFLASLARMLIEINWYAYHSSMIVLGFGSLPFCLFLCRVSSIPLPLSLVGLIGYLILAVTSLCAIVGFSLGLYVTLPVFVFEVTFGFWLLFKGKLVAEKA